MKFTDINSAEVAVRSATELKSQQLVCSCHVFVALCTLHEAHQMIRPLNPATPVATKLRLNGFDDQRPRLIDHPRIVEV